MPLNDPNYSVHEQPPPHDLTVPENNHIEQPAPSSPGPTLDESMKVAAMGTSSLLPQEGLQPTIDAMQGSPATRDHLDSNAGDDTHPQTSPEEALDLTYKTSPDVNNNLNPSPEPALPIDDTQATDIVVTMEDILSPSPKRKRKRWYPLPYSQERGTMSTIVGD
jgi:hypothetical protein